MFSNLKHSTCYMWLVWTLVPPHPKKNLGPVSFCWILNFSSISQAIIVGLAGLAMLQVTNPYTLVPFHNSFAFFPRIDCSTNCTIELTINQYIYMDIYIYTYLNVTYSSILGIQNSQWTNSAKHSGQLRKLITTNCDEPSFYQTVTHYYSLPSEAKYNLSLTSTAAGCVHSVWVS